jgi:hypothetical protein
VTTNTTLEPKTEFMYNKKMQACEKINKSTTFF